MIHLAYIFIVIFLSVFFQVLSGKCGLIFPLTGLSVFYLTIVYSWRTGIVLAIISGILVDILYGRVIFISPFLLVAVSLFAVLWLYKGDLRNLPVQAVPGLMVSLLYTSPILMINYLLFEKGIYLLLLNFFLLVVSLLFGIFFFPVYVCILDSLNKMLRINLYTKAKEKLMKES